MDVSTDFSEKNCQNKNDYSYSSLGAVFFESLKKYSSRILQYVADTDETDTYGQVLTHSIRTALKIKEKGISKDDIISTCTYNHKNSIVPFIASLLLNIKTTSFDSNLSHLDTVYLLKLIKPRIIFVAQEALAFMECCLRESEINTELVVFGESEKYSNFREYLEPNIEEDTFRPVPVDNPKGTAVILFSSGTTGLPKGICLSHYSLLAQIPRENLIEGKKSGRRSVLLCFTTLYWITAVAMLLKTIIEGSARVVSKNFDPDATWRLIEKYKVTSIFLAPHHAENFLSVPHNGIDTSSLEYFRTGGGPVTRELLDELKKALPTANILYCYGQSESCGIIANFSVNDPNEMELQKRKPSLYVKMRPGFKWKVVDPNTEKVLGPNQRGEFRYKTDSQMNGYYNIDSSPAYDSEGYIKSGDIIYFDEDDCLYIVDRIKEAFKFKQWHILPAVLEGILHTHPAVKEAVVIGIPHELEGDYPMGIVVINEHFESVTPEDIELYVRERVSDFQRLRAGVKIVKEIAKTVTGKIRRNEMKRMVLSGEI